MSMSYLVLLKMTTNKTQYTVDRTNSSHSNVKTADNLQISPMIDYLESLVTVETSTRTKLRTTSGK